MQTASSNFARAVSASSGVWAPPTVHADWANDGYGGDTTIDNLSDLYGRPIVINQALDDGMPSDVTLTSGRDATSKVTMPVGGRITGGVNFTAPQYWSVDNSTSPISSYDRDVAALTVNAGMVTSGGIERVTVFTGQMLDVAVTGRSATLTAQSQTRLKMTKRILPPAIAGDYAGLDATWPVSWALSQCGIYVSPPPRTGCRAWIPCHGSLVPFLDSTASYFGAFDALETTVASAALNTSNRVRPTFIDGPYLAAAFAEVTAVHNIQLGWLTVPFADGSDFLSKAGSAGRIEFWVRGDAADTAGTPGTVTPLVGNFDMVHDTGDPNTAEVTGGIGTDRKVFVTVADGAGHTATLKSASALATDGAWYFAGFAWDVAGKKLWVNLNGTVGSSAVSTYVTTSLPTVDSFDAGVSPGQFQSYLPIAEVHFTSGVQANPDNYVWLNDASYTASWTAGAIIRRSQLDLVGLAEQKPREAWEFVASFAQAELAMTRTDELDRFNYLPVSYWAETAQQTVADTWSTALNASGDFTISRDPTRVRNEVTVTYTDAYLDDPVALRAPLFMSFTVWTIPPGSTVTFPITWAVPVIYPDGLFTVLNATQAASLFATTAVTLNSSSDGTGTYATSAQVGVSIDSWDAGHAVLRFVNHTATTWYTANNGVNPFVQICGASLIIREATLTVDDTTSQAARGVRGLSVNLPAIQGLDTATRVAYNLLSRSLRPRPQLKAKLRADPRRQPGDLVTFADPGNTEVSGQWRSMAVDTTLNGADATQAATATKAWPVAVWGQTNWDEALWGP